MQVDKATVSQCLNAKIFSPKGGTFNRMAQPSHPVAEIKSFICPSKADSPKPTGYPTTLPRVYGKIETDFLWHLMCHLTTWNQFELYLGQTAFNWEKQVVDPSGIAEMIVQKGDLYVGRNGALMQCEYTN
jgi:hypothetical protein